MLLRVGSSLRVKLCTLQKECGHGEARFCLYLVIKIRFPHINNNLLGQDRYPHIGLRYHLDPTPRSELAVANLATSHDLSSLSQFRAIGSRPAIGSW